MSWPDGYDLPSKWKVFKGYIDIALGRLPASYDWRNHLVIPPAKYQGTCNSCTSFAISAAIEIATLIKKGGSAPDIAAQHMHTCIVNRGAENPQSICPKGIEPRRLLKLLVEYGYATSLADGSPFPPAACLGVATNSRLQGFTLITSSAARSSITTGPLVTDMYIWDDFFDYTIDRAPLYTPDTNRGHPRLHSVCVVGYLPGGWIIKNSFGTGWGDGNGFATIAAGACGLLTDAPPAGLAQRPAYTLEV